MDIKIIAAIVTTVCIIILGGFIVFDKSGHFDIKKIFVNYFEIFNNSKAKIGGIYIILLLLAVSVGIIEAVSDSLIETITLIISVLVGAFLAFLPVVIELREKKIESTKEYKYRKVCRETNDVLVYELLISIIELFFCFVYMFMYPKVNSNDIGYEVIKITFSAIIYYLVFIILLNILLILKRIRLLIGFASRHSND